MRVLLIYYTGTYNTRYLSYQVKEKFQALNYNVDLVEITSKTLPVSTDEYEYIGFSYPIYGFNSPLPFNKYVKKLKFKANQKYFIYKNSGEVLGMNNASSRILKRIMSHQKCKLVGEYHYVMPYNIHFPFDTSFIKQILNYNNKLLEIMMHNIKNNIMFKIKSNVIYNIGSWFVGIQKIGGNINSYFYKVDMNKCIKCNKCINNCPHDNIYIKKGKIKFHHHCDMCMRCSFFCPTDAISIGFLKNWKVQDYYNLNQIEKDSRIDDNYITEKSKGFYKCFIKYFKWIDEEYNKIFQTTL